MRPVVFAHLVTSGLGPVYDGIVHVLASPEDLIPVLGMGILAGQNGPRAARAALFTITTLWLAGSTLAWWLARPVLQALPATGSFILVGILIAAACRLPTGAIVLLSGILGILHGWLNGADMANDGSDPLALVGMAGVVFVLTALSSGHVASLTAPWSRIAVRVAGSWIAAIGLLMFGWALRG